jgi:Aminoglycoside-2''-adenylyltransferase
MNERTGAQLRVIKTVTNVLRAVDISAWLFGGWGLDARIGRITRDHGDIEFWLERVDAERSKAVLIGAGAAALATQPPEEACEFIWDGVEFSFAYFDRQPDGLFSQPQGRWSDWLFPLGSFGDEPGMLDGSPVPAMSVLGMLAMKEQFPNLRNGRPWRQKDIDDTKILRGLAADAPVRGGRGSGKHWFMTAAGQAGTGAGGPLRRECEHALTRD